MPNHVTNKLTVRKGSQKIIPALYSGTIEYNSIDEKLYDILRNFSFNKIIPQPQQDEDWDWYDWRNENWNTKWDAYIHDNPDEWQNKDKTINLINSFGEFLTAWSPPIKVVEKLQKMFPHYTFALDYIDEQFMYCGTVSVKGVDDYSEAEKDLRYYGAYLLNYSHKDLDEFFESCEENV
jgi:hypothetical protein